MNNFESVKNSVKNLIKIREKIDFFSIVSIECADVPLKRASNLTTHQAPKLHPEVEQCLKFDTIYNLYYPEAIAQLEATTVEEFNQNTGNKLDYAYIYRNKN